LESTKDVLMPEHSERSQVTASRCCKGGALH